MDLPRPRDLAPLLVAWAAGVWGLAVAMTFGPAVFLLGALLCSTLPETLASARAYGLLREACAPFAGDRPGEVELGVWSLVHGYALVAGAAEPARDPATGRVPAFATLLGHHLASGHSGPA